MKDYSIEIRNLPPYYGEKKEVQVIIIMPNGTEYKSGKTRQAYQALEDILGKIGREITTLKKLKKSMEKNYSDILETGLKVEQKGTAIITQYEYERDSQEPCTV